MEGNSQNEKILLLGRETEMFLEVIALAVIIGLVLRGRFMNLGRLNIKYIYVILFAYLLQAAIDFWAPRHAFWGYPYIHVFSYFLLFFALVRNRSIPGMYFILAGTIMNFLVIVLNGGMPVKGDVLPRQLAAAFATGHGGTHVLLTAGTRLSFLADIIYVVLPYQHQLLSIGDVIINVGVLVLVIKGMRGRALQNHR